MSRCDRTAIVTGGSRGIGFAVARKLAIILHRMWLDGTSFRWSNKATVVT